MFVRLCVWVFSDVLSNVTSNFVAEIALIFREFDLVCTSIIHSMFCCYRFWFLWCLNVVKYEHMILCVRENLQAAKVHYLNDTDSAFRAKVVLLKLRTYSRWKAFAQNVKCVRLVQVVSRTFAACWCCYGLRKLATYWSCLSWKSMLDKAWSDK
jgi:hypothetical protein